MKRRQFLKTALTGLAASTFSTFCCKSSTSKNRPNIILCMTDDQGWGDTGYNGHPILKTPNLDKMAGSGIRFERFYSAAPVCSPTRGSSLTGRHPYRYGIFTANDGHMRQKEVTLAELLKEFGYTTGHFGKWHLGTLTREIRDSNRGGRLEKNEHYCPPWDNGFDVCFSTEAKVPTWDPMKKPVKGASNLGWKYLKPDDAWEPYNTRYWTGSGKVCTDNLEGDDSRIIMDRVVPFIQNAVKSNSPFFTVIWFHSPHLPVVTGQKYLDMYPDQDLYFQNYYGCITAMDEQMGRLRKTLEQFGVAENTLIWFCSDNGPEGTENDPGSTGGLRGRKRSLLEGGIRVPGLLVWPEKITKSCKVTIPCCTSDYFPTIMDILGQYPSKNINPKDGTSLLPLINGKMEKRPQPVTFEFKTQYALVDNKYKLYSSDLGKTWELYDIVNDPSELKNLSEEKPQILENMRVEIEKWRDSCKQSLNGKDYL